MYRWTNYSGISVSANEKPRQQKLLSERIGTFLLMAASLVEVFVATVLPVLLVAFVGYLLGELSDIAVEPLNTVTLYVLLPALVFYSLTTTEVGGRGITVVVGSVVAFTLGMVALSLLVGRALGTGSDGLRGLVLASAFPNVGNFGIPVSMAAFGSVGRDTAVLFVIGQSMLLFTVGVYVAAGGMTVSSREPLRRIATFPLLYVVLAAALLRLAGIELSPSDPLMGTVEMVGNASIPLFLIILGMQLSRTDAGATLRRTTPALAMKLAVAPVLAAGLVLVVEFPAPEVAQTFILLAAGPVAVAPLSLAIEFSGGDSETAVTTPEYLSTVIFITTVASMVTVSVLVFVFRAGWVP